jgi:hypothetical protein
MTHNQSMTQPEYDTQSQHDTQPQHGIQPEHDMCSGQDMQKETLSPSSSFSNTNAKWTVKRLRSRSGAKGIGIDRRLEDSHEQTSPKVTSPKTGLPWSRKRKRGGDLTQLAGRFGSVNVREEMEEMEERYSASSKPHSPQCSNAERLLNHLQTGSGPVLRGLPLLRMRLERRFISEKMYRIRKRMTLQTFTIL